MRLVCIAGAIALGAAAAWTSRHSMNVDGVSYLDLADAIRHGEWRRALNPYWAPGYPALIAAFVATIDPTPSGEFAVVHLANFAAFVLALLAFDWLLRALLDTADPGTPGGSGRRDDFLLAGFAVFTWSMVTLATLTVVTPDILMAAFVFAAAALGARVYERLTRAADAPAWPFGLALGMGYLVKTVMMAVAPLMLAAFWFARPRRARALHSFAAAAIGFILVASLYVVPLSIQRGRLTAGDTGRLTYAWLAGGVTEYVHWQGDSASESGIAAHPTRTICEAPPAYEFAGPIQATYPPWFDPAYWHEGLRIRPRWSAQRRALVTSAQNLAALGRQALIPLALIVVLALRRGAAAPWRRDAVALLLTCALTVAMYSVMIVTTRHLAAFVAMATVAVIALCANPSADRPAGAENGAGPLFLRPDRAQSAALRIAAALLFALAIAHVWREAANDRDEIRRGRPPHLYAAVAETLSREGLGAGDPVAVIGEGAAAAWARILRARIVAEIPDRDRFWRVDAASRAACLARLWTIGVKVIVIDRPPRPGERAWRPIGATGHWRLGPVS